MFAEQTRIEANAAPVLAPGLAVSSLSSWWPHLVAAWSASGNVIRYGMTARVCNFDLRLTSAPPMCMSRLRRSSVELVLAATQVGQD